MTDQQLLAQYGLTLCDGDCPCGDASMLVFVDLNKDRDPRLPDWINGVSLDEAKAWISTQEQTND